jgi:hypothetical protein
MGSFRAVEAEHWWNVPPQRSRLSIDDEHIGLIIVLPETSSIVLGRSGG